MKPRPRPNVAANLPPVSNEDRQSRTTRRQTVGGVATAAPLTPSASSGGPSTRHSPQAARTTQALLARAQSFSHHATATPGLSPTAVPASVASGRRASPIPPPPDAGTTRHHNPNPHLDPLPETRRTPNGEPAPKQDGPGLAVAHTFHVPNTSRRTLDLGVGRPRASPIPMVTHGLRASPAHSPGGHGHSPRNLAPLRAHSPGAALVGPLNAQQVLEEADDDDEEDDLAFAASYNDLPTISTARPHGHLPALSNAPPSPAAASGRTPTTRPTHSQLQGTPSVTSAAITPTSVKTPMSKAMPLAASRRNSTTQQRSGAGASSTSRRSSSSSAAAPGVRGASRRPENRRSSGGGVVAEGDAATAAGGGGGSNPPSGHLSRTGSLSATATAGMLQRTSSLQNNEPTSRTRLDARNQKLLAENIALEAQLDRRHANHTPQATLARRWMELLVHHRVSTRWVDAWRAQTQQDTAAARARTVLATKGVELVHRWQRRRRIHAELVLDRFLRRWVASFRIRHRRPAAERIIHFLRNQAGSVFFCFAGLRARVIRIQRAARLLFLRRIAQEELCWRRIRCEPTDSKRDPTRTVEFRYWHKVGPRNGFATGKENWERMALDASAMPRLPEPFIRFGLRSAITAAARRYHRRTLQWQREAAAAAAATASTLRRYGQMDPRRAQQEEAAQTLAPWGLRTLIPSSSSREASTSPQRSPPRLLDAAARYRAHQVCRVQLGRLRMSGGSSRFASLTENELFAVLDDACISAAGFQSDPRWRAHLDNNPSL